MRPRSAGQVQAGGAILKLHRIGLIPFKTNDNQDVWYGRGLYNTWTLKLDLDRSIVGKSSTVFPVLKGSTFEVDVMIYRGSDYWEGVRVLFRIQNTNCPIRSVYLDTGNPTGNETNVMIKKFIRKYFDNFKHAFQLKKWPKITVNVYNYHFSRAR